MWSRRRFLGLGALEFGVRLEDELVISEEGAYLLTPQSPSLTEPF